MCLATAAKQSEMFCNFNASVWCIRFSKWREAWLFYLPNRLNHQPSLNASVYKVHRRLQSEKQAMLISLPKSAFWSLNIMEMVADGMPCCGSYRTRSRIRAPEAHVPVGLSQQQYFTISPSRLELRYLCRAYRQASCTSSGSRKWFDSDKRA